MATDDVSLNFGANIAPLLAAMERGAEATRNATAQMTKSIESISGALAKVQGAFIAFAAVASGGAAMKKLITDAGDWQIQALKLSKALGISTEQASVYQIALHRLGISSDVMLTASTKLSKNIYTNHDAFVRLGVATKDAHGNYLPLAGVMDTVNAKLAAIKNPVEQNIQGLAVYGRQWAELRPLLRLTAAEMQHAEERGRELGLIVSGPGSAAARTYKTALADVDLVGKSLSVQLGNKLLPVMTAVGTAFASAAPEIGETFGNALKFVAKVAIDVGATFQALGTHIGGLLAAAGAALQGNFSGAWEVLKQMSTDVDAIAAKAEKMKAAIDKPVEAGSAPDLGDDGKGSGSGDKDQVAKWTAELAERKAAYEAQSAAGGQFREFDKAQERQFWQDRLAQVVRGTTEEREIRSKIAEATAVIEKKSFEAKVATLKAEEAEYKHNTEARLTIEHELAERLKIAYGANSTQYAEALKAIKASEKQAADDILQIRLKAMEAQRGVQMAEVAEREAQARFDVEMGRKTQSELLSQEQGFENERFAIKRDALVRALALEAEDPDRDPKKIAQLNAEILALETEHQAALSNLRRRSVAESSKNYGDFVKGVSSGFQNVIAGFLKGTQTLGQTIKGLFASVLDAVANTIAKMAAEWIAKKLMMLAADKATGASSVATSVAEAGAAGVASFAGAPWPIDLGAPAFGAAMAATAAGYGVVASAAGGYDIPAGVNPIIQAHAREMVIPEAQADVIRGMADGGGGGAIHVHNHFNALDGASVKRVVASSDFQKSFRTAINRNFSRVR